MKKYLMLAAILAVGTTAMAEENLASQKLKETVISTENFETSVLDTAKNITIVTQEDIQNKGANTVAEALRGVPGLVVSYMDGSDPYFDLRGYGATASQNTLILIDGIPLNNVTGGGFNTSQIPVNMISKIEVIPFGGAIMYGDGTTGGLINIITNSPENKMNYGSVGLEAGSWGTIKGNLNYGTKVTDRLLMEVAYSSYRSEGFRSKNPNDKTYNPDGSVTLAPTRYDKDDTKESIWLRGKYLLDNGSIEANYRHNESEDYYTGYLEKDQFEKDPSMPGDYNGVVENKEESYSLKYNQKINDKVDLLVYGGYGEIKSEGPYANTLASQYFIKPQVKYSYGDNSYIIVGGDYKDGKLEDKKDPSARDKKRESYAGYILNKTTVGDWQFTQGYRREKIKYDSDIFTSAPTVDNPYNTEKIGEAKDHTADSIELGVNYLYSNTGSIYFSFVDGYRSPSINDMGLWKGDIKLQSSRNYELGIKDMYKNTYVSASVFLIDTKDEIYYDKTDANNSINKNFDGEVRRIGAQASLQHYFDKLTLRENITYIQPKVTSGIYDGNEFAGVPRWNINLGATYKFTEKLTGNTDLYYQSSAYAQDDFDNYFSKENDFITVDANLNYKVNDGLEVYTGVRNLFDEEYANAITSTRSPWNPRTVFYPADGRSYYAGFRYNF